MAKKVNTVKSRTAKKRKRKKKTIHQNDGFFCTECGEQLDDFCFSSSASDKKKVLKNHEKCVRTGKFSGVICSKAFISSESLLEDIWDIKID